MDMSAFMPHGMCFLWRPDLLGMHVISDLFIVLAYFSIPVTIVVLLRQRRVAIPFRWVFLSFATFILLCGVSHLMSIVVIWYPMYYAQGVIKMLTAAASVTTAILVFPIVPTILEMLGASGADRETASGSPGALDAD